MSEFSSRGERVGEGGEGGRREERKGKERKGKERKGEGGLYSRGRKEEGEGEISPCFCAEKEERKTERC